MLKLSKVTKVKVFFLVLVYVFNFDLFEFSAAILEEGLLKLEGTAQTGVFMLFFPPETLLTSIKEHQTITTHNTNRHRPVRFYACARHSVQTGPNSCI